MDAGATFSTLRDRLLGRVHRGWAIALLVIVAVSCVDHAVNGRRDLDDRRHFEHQTFRVDHVSDGDTLVLHTPGVADGQTRVRLIGIDAIELTQPGDLGERARDYVKARIAGNDGQVTLRLDEHRTRDKYRRLLAYVYLRRGEILNEAVVRDGWAFAYRPIPHSLEDHFEQSESGARSKRRGMWKSITTDQMPEWRQQWMNERRLVWKP